ncbi:MAG TPA: GWxTD domain-containing protein [Candidatus Acidoferrales bacterium]|nr:GWxTD domain-containing protein [Candidatus Acidoferrales bacterium]
MRILESFVESPLAGAIGWTLLHSLWEGAFISVILAAVLLATRSARIRYVAACVAMIAVVVGFAITLYRLMPQSIQTFPGFRAAVPFIPVANAPSRANIGPSWLSILTAVAPWLAPFWIIGVLLLSLQRVMSFFGVRKLRTRGICFASEQWHAELARLAGQLRISRPVHLLESCFAEIPMVLGHLRPVILMPVGLLANLPSEQIEAVLLHELAHIRRRDYLVNVFQRLVESILFYHPAIWWISKIMRNERENCCDDIVVSISQRANEYALALAALERNRLPSHQAAVAATGGILVKRIRRLLYPKAPAGIWAPIAAAIILVATAAVSVAAWQPKAAQSVVALVRTGAKTTVVSARSKAQVQPLATEAGTKTGPYWEWLDEDVLYIITPAERSNFLQLKTDEQRDEFIKEFWERRNPAPGAADNTYKDEHYRRIAYANEHFASPSGIPGWKTDRGRIYITWGPPDQRDEHSAGELSHRPMDQGGGAATTFAYEDWRYRQITQNNSARAENVEFEFVDPAGTGDFYLTMNPGEKYAEAISSQTTQQGELPIVKTLYIPNGIGPSRANRIVAELVLQYGGGHAQYVPAQNAIVVRGSAGEIATGQHLIDLASRTSPHAAASAPEPKGMVTMARETTTNSRGAKTVFGILEATQKWLNEDVVYIITDEERDTFLHLKTDEERQQFITAFWERRNPTPGSADNKFKDDHYRRIAYANEHFATAG